jgi:hypothetical protein
MGRPLPPPPRQAATPKPVRHRRYRRLATVLTVVTLLGAAAWGGVLLFGRGDDPEQTTRHLLAALAQSVEEYRERTGALPEDLNALVGLETCYDGGVCPRDAYGSMIQYRRVDGPPVAFRLRSAGADRRLSTPDDVLFPPGSRWEDDEPVR